MSELRDYLFYEEPSITLYCGDCREVLPLLGAEAPDIIVTDPPYGMGRFATDGKDYLDAVGPALRLSFAALKEGGSMFVFRKDGTFGICLACVTKRIVAKGKKRRGSDA